MCHPRQVYYTFGVSATTVDTHEVCYIFSCSAEYLVRVKAQVMTRDDSTGGWVPMGGGGVSIVGLRKRVHPTAQQDDMRHEYLISGQRMSDNSVSTRLHSNGNQRTSHGRMLCMFFYHFSLTLFAGGWFTNVCESFNIVYPCYLGGHCWWP